MERKTKVHAEDGKQELAITRQFYLPLELLFKAHVEPEIIEQWMGTKVLKLEGKKHGAYQFETTDPKGNKHWIHIVFGTPIVGYVYSPFEQIPNSCNSPFGIMDVERPSPSPPCFEGSGQHDAADNPIEDTANKRK